MIAVGNDIAAKQIASEIAYLEYKARDEVIYITGGSSGGYQSKDFEDLQNYYRPFLEKTRVLIREVSNLPEKEPTVTEK